jgi:hypothetical protein
VHRVLEAAPVQAAPVPAVAGPQPRHPGGDVGPHGAAPGRVVGPVDVERQAPGVVARPAGVPDLPAAEPAGVVLLAQVAPPLGLVQQQVGQPGHALVDVDGHARAVGGDPGHVSEPVVGPAVAPALVPRADRVVVDLEPHQGSSSSGSGCSPSGSSS